MLLPLLPLLALPLAHAAGAISGIGIISVLVDTTNDIVFTTATPSLAIGCLNAAGKVVLDDCASFTADGRGASTDDGLCSFYNEDAPVNADAIYGGTVHALACSNATAAMSVQFYTISGMAYDFIGQGDTNFYYDVPGLPALSKDELDIWFFTWGSKQKSVPEGHYKALLLWEPTS